MKNPWVVNKVYGDMTYQEYLQSWQWKEKSEWIKYIRGNECQKCKSKKGLQVHHIRYDSLGNEAGEDVIVLCKECHKKEHGIGKHK